MKYFLYFLMGVAGLEILFMLIKVIFGRHPDSWTGGNGCNLFHSAKRANCCYHHDYAYRAGGWPWDRWIADYKLFRCIGSSSNIFLAALMFVGVLFFGPPAFQYGPKRVLIPRKDELIDSLAANFVMDGNTIGFEPEPPSE